MARMRELAVEHPRRGHRYVMDLLRKERWTIGTQLEGWTDESDPVSCASLVSNADDRAIRILAIRRTDHCWTLVV
jgi:hypothetical protein